MLFWCDNQAVFNIINSHTSKSLKVMGLIQRFVLQYLQFNFHFTACYVPDLSYATADSLFHFQFWRVLSVAPRGNSFSRSGAHEALETWRMKIGRVVQQLLTSSMKAAYSSNIHTYLGLGAEHSWGTVWPVAVDTVMHFYWSEATSNWLQSGRGINGLIE